MRTPHGNFRLADKEPSPSRLLVRFGSLSATHFPFRAAYVCVCMCLLLVTDLGGAGRYQHAHSEVGPMAAVMPLGRARAQERLCE